MSSAPTPPPATRCARHPDVETGLACGRCETPICPKCLVYTPAGTRCPDCAAIGRPKMYILGPLDYARAVATVVVVGLAVGGLYGIVLSPSPRIGLFSLLIGGAAGYGVGAAIAALLDVTTSRKRGRQIQMVAAGGVVLVWLTRLVVSGVPLGWALRDFTGFALVAVAISVASQRLR